MTTRAQEHAAYRAGGEAWALRQNAGTSRRHPMTTTWSAFERSLLTRALAGVLVLGAVACGKSAEPPPPQHDSTGVTAMQGGKPPAPVPGAAVPPGTRKATPGKKPNVVFIMGDDVGWANIGVYNQGIMAGRTPNLDQLAAEGTRFTDYYAEPSCTAGRANFITGQLPIRTGLTTVGQAGATVGMPDAAPTIATLLRSMGYATGQFGKNHLGDRNEYLPTLHGFDEFFGYLYHLDAMEDPFWHSYPPDLVSRVGPRNMVHSWASDRDDGTNDPRWGKVGKQRVEDAGPMPPKRMQTVDDEIRDAAFAFMDKAKKDNKPFFVWLNPTRMHVYTHLSDEYASRMTPTNGWYPYEAGMAQLDDEVGAVMKKLQNDGLDGDTILVFTTDNGAEVFSWPDGGLTPFAGEKGMILEGGVRVPCIVRWPGRVPAARVENGIMSGLDWLPTLVAAAGDAGVVSGLLGGRTIGDSRYKVHLDGYDQLDFITGAGPSARNEIWYFAEGQLGAVRIGDWKYRFVDQPNGWFGGTVMMDMPAFTNLRLDPYERTGATKTPPYLYDFMGHEFWRAVYVQEEVAKLGQSLVDFPPMQKGASFNIESVKQQVVAAIKKKQGVGE
jgi:arylsulfatase